MDKDKLQLYLNKYKAFKQRSWNPRSARNNAYHFGLLMDFLNGRDLDTDSLLDFFNHLATTGLSESTRNSCERKNIAFIRWLFNQGYTDKFIAANIEKTRVHRKSRILPSQQEIIELIKQATEVKEGDNKLTRFSKKEHRACLLFMVVACGGRNFETSHLKRTDVSLSGMQIELTEGKGGARTQAIPNIKWLIDDLRTRVEGKRTEEELEVLADRGHFKESAVDRLFVVNSNKLQETMRAVGKLWGRPLNVHDLRRIYARDLKSNGSGTDEIRDAMSHKNIETTMRYLEYDTSTQAKTLKNFSSEALKYRTNQEKAKELLDLAYRLENILEVDDSCGVLTLKVRSA